MSLDPGLDKGSALQRIPGRVTRLVELGVVSRNPALVLEAARVRRAAPVLDFLRAGGAIDRAKVTYRRTALPRAAFAGSRLGALTHLRNLVDGGHDVTPSGADFAVTVAGGPRFVASVESLAHTLLMIDERFVQNEYALLAVKSAVVIDIGANIADSALYFVWKGARHVYAYEPLTLFHDAAVANIALNGRTDAVDLIHAAIGPNDSTPTINVEGQSWTGPDGRMIECTLRPIREVIRSASLRHPGVDVVCKIDCEGCEYDLLDNGSLDEMTLRPVRQLMVEYHRPSSDPIVGVLRGFGFEITDLGHSHGAGLLLAARDRTPD